MDLLPGAPGGIAFDIPNVLEKDGGSVFGRLPTTGDLDGGNQGAYPAILVEDRDTPRTSRILSTRRFRIALLGPKQLFRH
jgi:hypothetical protein